MRHVIFRVGSERYALPLTAVREVVSPAAMSQVPRSPPATCGIMNLRGRVVTVVQLAALLGLEIRPAEALATGQVLVLERGRRDLGMFVTEVDGILPLEEPVLPAPGEALKAVRGIARVQAGAVTVLDAEGLETQLVALLTGR